MTDDVKGAIVGLEELTLKKKHFSLLYEIALLYSMDGDDKKALLFLYKALLCEGKIEMKLNVIYKTAQTLQKLERMDDALMHYQLCKAVREKNGWSIPNDLVDAIKRCGDGKVDFSVLTQRLSKMWIHELKNTLGVVYGKINKILDNKNGFIKYDDKSIYYRHNNIFQCNKVYQNEKVSFCISKSYDKKKNRDSYEAIYIETIE